jgi:sulfane dehydrogenase subunit SoxC
MNTKESTRRKFLKNGAALAGLVAGGARLAKGQEAPPCSAEKTPKQLHAYGERSHFETSVRLGNNNRWDRYPTPGNYYVGGPRTPLQDSIGIITPAPLHYFVSHSSEPPDINPREHRLLIHGLVDHPLLLSMEDLKRLPFVSQVHYVECRANGAQTNRVRKNPSSTVQETHGLTSCSEWTGVPLSLLLKEAGVKKEGSWVVAEGAEMKKHFKSIPIEKVMDDVLVAYGQNGEAVRPEQGYPLRLLVPGWQGVNNVKWLRRIKVVDEPYMGMMESTQYIEQRPDGKGRWFTSQLGPSSVITRPSGGQQMPEAGYYMISGLAWSGGGAVQKVEVSTDGGKTWKEAEIQGPVHRKAHTRFRLPWTWNGEEALLQSRCTDETGDVQPTVAEILKIWNLSSDFLRTFDGIFGNLNAIQPWRVLPGGRVQNALPI